MVVRGVFAGSLVREKSNFLRSPGFRRSKRSGFGRGLGKKNRRQDRRRYHALSLFEGLPPDPSRLFREALVAREFLLQ
jgi:hypothetical protein